MRDTQIIAKTLQKTVDLYVLRWEVLPVPSERKTPIGLRLEPEVMKVLAKAAQAAGVSKTKIIEECVSRYAGLYVKESLEERQKIFARYLQSSSPNKKKPSPRG